MNWLTVLFCLPHTLEKIMTTLNQLAETLITIQTQLIKAQTEITTKIQELQDALVNVTLPVEAEQALADLVVSAQSLDDVIPDQITPE